MSSASTPETAPSAAPRRSRLRGCVGKLVLLGVTTLVCALLLEVAVRILFPYYNPKNRIVYYANPDGVSLGPANATIHHGTPKGDFNLTIHFNQYGLRDTKDLKSSTTNDVFALGDSFTMGWGVPENERFSNVLEAKLKRPVFNVASPENILGYVKLLRYAEQNGAQVRHLVIGICMENDLRDYRDGKTSADFMKPSGGAKFSLRLWLLKHSAAYTATTYVLQSSPAIRGLLERTGLAKSTQVTLGKNVFSEDILQSSAAEVAKLATARRAVVLIIPSRALWLGGNQEVEKQVHARFVELLQGHGLSVVDPKARLEATGEPLSYYFVSDPHWRANGHELAADELSKFLLAHPEFFAQ